MSTYVRHVLYCHRCAHPYNTYSRRISLCDKGIIKVKDVVQYVYSLNEKIYSAVDKGSQSVLIEISPGHTPARELLKVIERDIQLDARLNKPIISNHYIPSRLVYENAPPSHIAIKLRKSGREGKRDYIHGQLYHSDKENVLPPYITTESRKSEREGKRDYIRGQLYHSNKAKSKEHSKHSSVSDLVRGILLADAIIAIL